MGCTHGSWQMKIWRKPWRPRDMNISSSSLATPATLTFQLFARPYQRLFYGFGTATIRPSRARSTLIRQASARGRSPRGIEPRANVFIRLAGHQAPFDLRWFLDLHTEFEPRGPCTRRRGTGSTRPHTSLNPTPPH